MRDSVSTIIPQFTFAYEKLPDLGWVERSVQSVMSEPVVTVSPDTPAEDTTQLLLAHGIRRLPVMENESQIGIVTERDLMRWVLGAFYEPNIPPDISEILPLAEA